MSNFTTEIIDNAINASADVKTEEEEITKEIEAELGLSDEIFSSPEGHFGLSSKEELLMAIENCKELSKEAENGSLRHKILVQKLVDLRIKLRKMKEPEIIPEDVTCIAGHHFEAKNLDNPREYCDHCCGLIWTAILNGWLHCKNCGYKCHSKCVSKVSRPCAKLKVDESPYYIMSLCPEVGLSAQGYRCAECRKVINFKDDPRRCDYNGLYYCSSCHWNSQAIIPARVIHNWDFMPRKVCRASFQFLKLMMKKPALNIEKLNNNLYTFINELTEVRNLRKEILSLKEQYFLSCHQALEGGLLFELRHRQHFVESIDVYSLQDLIELEQKLLVPNLFEIHSKYLEHVTKLCQGCRGKGFICELCNLDDVLFPFDTRSACCTKCSTVYHQECFEAKEKFCPKCERKKMQMK